VCCILSGFYNFGTVKLSRKPLFTFFTNYTKCWLSCVCVWVVRSQKHIFSWLIQSSHFTGQCKQRSWPTWMHQQQWCTRPCTFHLVTFCMTHIDLQCCMVVSIDTHPHCWHWVVFPPEKPISRHVLWFLKGFSHGNTKGVSFMFLIDRFFVFLKIYLWETW